MLYSHLFGKTTKSSPSTAQAVSHKLLYRGGFIRESTAGRYYFLPLGRRVQQKIMAIIKKEMDSAGAQELITPVLHPLSLWQETNRTKTTGFELMKIKDRRNFEFALGGTAEEMIIDLVRKFQISYKDLPFNIYQFSSKFRDELRARGGLLRVREFIMKDAYSFDRNEKEFKKEYQNMWKTYKKIFNQLGLKTIVVESDNGYIGGEYCHEFVVESGIGESKFFITADGSYAAHEEVAGFYKEIKNEDEKPQPLIQVEAKRGTTMEDGVKLHNKPLWRQIKSVLYVDETGRYILAVIRGDYDINETKLRHITGAIELTHAGNDEIRNIIHSEPGFISPVGIKELVEPKTQLIIVADDSLKTIKNAYGGTNKKNLDYLNINIERDYQPDHIGDIALAKAGYLSIRNKKPLIEKRGIEVGNIFQLGYHYTHLMKNAVFIDKDGKEKPYYMGCYGIGIGRTIASIVELNHDDKGIIWPGCVSPFQIHLVGLNLNESKIKKKSFETYHRLKQIGFDVLFDDRQNVSAGEKFADADLIGISIRLVISKKTGGKIEFKRRDRSEKKLLSFEQISQNIDLNK